MKNMLALSQERFSARKFTSEAVSQEDVDYIMECVRLAPSAVNRQPWHCGSSSARMRLRRNSRSATTVSGSRQPQCILWE